MNQKYITAFALALLSCVIPASASTLRPNYNGIHTDSLVHEVMDAWHYAASVADSNTYFGTMASEKSIFIGTDETERWTTTEFKKWSRRFFQRSSAWTFVPVPGERHVTIHGDVAWLDEKLDSKHMGRCRGTGILTFNYDANTWKIEHYTLSYSVPNEVADSVMEVIASSTSTI